MKPSYYRYKLKNDLGIVIIYEINKQYGIIITIENKLIQSLKEGQLYDAHFDPYFQYREKITDLKEIKQLDRKRLLLEI